MNIHVLDSNVSNLIAAGEVVERPASVVKELVENSIDAGADVINIEIEDGGKKLIRISDNGCGMSSEDAELCFVKHATSKIVDKDDLFHIKTLGFRGEALAAISAVSVIDMTTKTENSLCGYQYHVVSGQIVKTEEIGCIRGTTIAVQNLFYNTPARLKFLKSVHTETGNITALVTKLVLSHPNISFTLVVNGREQLFTSGNGQLKDTVFAVYGKSYTENLLEVNYQDERYKINGFVGSPLFNKPNRNWQLFYVNNRIVKSKVLQNTLENSFRNSMLISRYPVCVLFFSVNVEDVDVNVHPSKLEVKFSDEKSIGSALFSAIQKSLMYDSGIAKMNIVDAHQTVEKIREDLFTQEEIKLVAPPPVEVIQHQEIKPKQINGWMITPSKEVSPNDKTVKDLKTYTQLSDYFEEKPLKVASPMLEILPFREKDGQIEKSVGAESTYTEEDFVLIGEAFHSFIIIQKGEDILFIDKHALHERMLFEKLKTEKIESQILLSPLIMDFGPDENSLLIQHADELSTSGFDIEDFGGSIIVRCIPQILENRDVESVLQAYVDDCLSLKGEKNEVVDEFLHTVACKAAVKSGMQTSLYELENLIKKYFQKEKSLKYCPHGRPITFALSKKEIEKQFKRIV